LRWLRRYGIHQLDFRLPGGDLNPTSDIPSAGYNAGLSALHATIGLSQFDMLPERLARARRNAAQLDVAVRRIPGLTALTRATDSVSGWWVYALRARRRDAVIAGLHARGIGAQRLHLRNDRYSCFEPAPQDLPGVVAFDAENLAVPCGWWVDDAGCSRIIEALVACA
jgi:dTDP-4-amino-4,6-dideoxygalactose transaminase